jgi:2OG-Fe(II) oxygenase superfamily
MWNRFLKQAFGRRNSFTGDAVIGLVVLPVGCAGLLVEAYLRTDLKSASTASQCSCTLTRSVMTQLHVRKLERDGIVVIPNVLSSAQLTCVQRCVDDLESIFDESGNEKSVRQDRVQWVRSDGNEDGNGHGNEDGALHKNSLQEAIQLLRGVADVLEQSGYSRARNYQIPQDCQLAVYQGNDSDGYERHLDRCTGTVNDLGLLEYWRLSDFRCRVVTVILYLNAKGRSDDEGGHLRCWANPNSDEHFNITPVGGTLVIFDSSQIYHRVMPSKTLRMALTSWVHGDLAEQNISNVQL